jgi:hypothetical protein
MEQVDVDSNNEKYAGAIDALLKLYKEPSKEE